MGGDGMMGGNGMMDSNGMMGDGGIVKFGLCCFQHLVSVRFTVCLLSQRTFSPSNLKSVTISSGGGRVGECLCLYVQFGLFILCYLALEHTFPDL